ncbi:heat shock factor protein 4 [Electrophorus electricus]|uniref:heat shock factor protein 4 n=1 Tax=Electrophorus electricus TaxID=8005 RepID=UPI000F09FB3E|nr:heat shock factor protein 4 [Electrophorus electricus]
MQESPGSIGVDGGYGSNVPAFLNKLWTLVEDPDTNHLICWSTTGTSFHVFDQGRFAKEVLPKYFKHNNMASFVRQLNMYGFRKVVNIEQSGLVKPERDDTEFQHLYFLQGREHLLEHIKRKVSIVKSEETKVRQEDLSRLLYEVQVLRGQQDSMESKMQDMKQQNEVLWKEVVSLRLNHTQQQKVMNKLIQFLFSQMQPSAPGTVGMKRKLPLMLDDGSSTPPVSKFSHVHVMEHTQEPFCIQSPSTETASCSTTSMVTGGPTISDVTEMSHLSMYGQSREKCLMLIKEEPLSPSVRGRGEGIPFGSCEMCAEPPILPVAMVQSVLEGRGASPEERQAKRTMLDRPEMCDAVENVDMSLEELQFLLRGHQQSMEPRTAAVNPFTFGLPVDEWSLTELDPNLKSELANFLITAVLS